MSAGLKIDVTVKKGVKQLILKARKFTRKDLLYQDSKTKGRNKLVFNIAYHPAYSKLKIFLSRGKSLKDSLARAKVPVEKELDWKSCGCHEKRCEACTFSEEKSTFTKKEGSDTFISIVTQKMYFF